MHGIYVKGNSSKPYTRGKDLPWSGHRATERGQNIYIYIYPRRSLERQEEREGGLPVRYNFTTRKNVGIKGKEMTCL